MTTKTTNRTQHVNAMRARTVEGRPIVLSMRPTNGQYEALLALLRTGLYGHTMAGALSRIVSEHLNEHRRLWNPEGTRP